MITEVTGKIYPNGEFGIARTKKFTPKELPEKRPDRRKMDIVREAVASGVKLESILEWERERAQPLGSSLLPNSPTRSPRGSNGITRSAARNVRNAAWLMEKRYGRRVLTFATLTLPKVAQEESELLSRDWHKIVKNLVKQIRRDLERYRLPPVVVGVTEIQTERTNKYRVLGLHLHLLWVGRKSSGSWVISTKRIDELWEREVERVLSRTVEISSACNLQMVRRSAQGYLGKYMSKGTKTLNHIKETLPGMTLPSAWHTMTRTLLHWIQQMTITDSDIVHSLWHDCWAKRPSLLEFSGLIKIEVSEGWDYICGAYGRVKSEFLNWLITEHLSNNVVGKFYDMLKSVVNDRFLWSARLCLSVMH